jgi:hypothetical protein
MISQPPDLIHLSREYHIIEMLERVVEFSAFLIYSFNH